MNILERQILSDIDNIETVTLEAEYNVLSTLIDCYNKQSMIMEYYKGDDITEFSIFQEGFSDIINTAKGDSSENLFLRIIKFIPRLIGAIVKAIKNFFKKNKDDEIVNMIEKNTEQIEKLRESIKQDIDSGKTSVDEICREYTKKHGGYTGPKSDTLYRLKSFINNGYIIVDKDRIDIDDLTDYIKELKNIMSRNNVYDKQTLSEFEQLPSLEITKKLNNVPIAKHLRREEIKGLSIDEYRLIFSKLKKLLHESETMVQQCGMNQPDINGDIFKGVEDALKCLNNIHRYVILKLYEVNDTIEIIRFLNARDRFINQKKNSTEYRLRQSEKELRKANAEMNAVKNKAMSNIANRHAIAGKIISDAYKNIMTPLDPIDNEPINDDSDILSKNQSELDKISKDLDDLLSDL